MNQIRVPLAIESDLHIHTTLSACCSDPAQTVEKVSQLLATRYHIRKAAFTDHLWNNPTIPPSSWYAPQDGSAILRRKSTMATADLPLAVLFGCEADMIAPDKIGITKELAEQMDIVLLSSDHFHMREFVEQPTEPTPGKLAPHMMKFFRAAAICGLAHVLVHPLYPLSYDSIYAKTMECVSDAELDESLRMAAGNGVAIEINGSVLEKAKKTDGNYQTYIRVMEAAKNAGCRFTFGSDSHAEKSFFVYDTIRIFIDEIGLTAEHLHPLARL